MSQYTNIVKDIFDYVRAIGGIRAILASPYLHISILLGMLLSPRFTASEVYTLSVSLIPNLLGFSLGAFAIFLAVGSEKFHELLSGDEKSGRSILIRGSGIFVHFILSQVFVLVYGFVFHKFSLSTIAFSILAWGQYNLTLGDFLLFVFVSALLYAILHVVAVSLTIFKVSRWYNMKLVSDLDRKKK